MSFYPQPNRYECGPFALKHALAVLGVFAEERRIASLAGTTTAGTDEIQLARAAVRYGCDLPTRRVSDPETARDALVRELSAGHPVLTCVDEWSHWIAVASERDGRFVIADSAEDSVFRVVGWDELRQRWGLRSHESGVEADLFDLNPVVPRGVLPRAELQPERVGYLTGIGRELVRDWSHYVRDILEVGGMARGREDDPSVQPLALVLQRHRRALLDRVDGKGPSHRDAARIALDRIAFAADAYGVCVLPLHTDDALGLSETLARHVVGRRWRRLGVRRTAYEPSPTPSIVET
jgi:hypothetical protein